MPEIHPSVLYFGEAIPMPTRSNRQATGNLVAHVMSPELVNNFVEVKSQMLQVNGPPR